MPKSTRQSRQDSLYGLDYTQRMQQQADIYTQKYEWERRTLLALQSSITNVQQQLQARQASVTELKRQCDLGRTKLAFTKMRNLQKQIDIFDKRYNDTLGDIDKTKKQIDALRQARILYMDNLKQTEQDIKNARQLTDSKLDAIGGSMSQSQGSQNIMLGLKMRNQQDKTQYYKVLKELNQQLREAQLAHKNRVELSEANALQTDTSTILRRRLTKLIVNNKQRVKLIDNYQRNMKVIDQAFNTIKQATGLTDIQEIQNIFIKGQQQNYGLLTYVDVLNQQIDTLKDSNQHLRNRNAQIKRDNQQKHRILNGTPDEQRRRKKINQIVKDKTSQSNQFQSLLNSIQPRVQQVLIKLAKSKFNTANDNRAYEYQLNGVTLNQNSLDQVLAETQDYINKMLLAKGKDQPTSELFAKTLLLEDIPAKQFKRRVIDNQIQANSGDDPEVQKQLLDKKKLNDIANREIEKVKNSGIQKLKKK